MRVSKSLAAIATALFVFAPLASAAPMVIGHSARNDVSRPMRDILAELPPGTDQGTTAQPYEVPNIFPKPTRAWQSEFLRELATRDVQSAPINVPAPTPMLSVIGLIAGAASGPGNAGNSVPPDTNGDVSDIHYIQWLNTRWAIFDKATGARLTASAPGNSFFAGFGGRCETTNAGDPIALWDARAQRWLMSQFATYGSVANAARQCVAISTTSDPLGTYYRYEFIWPPGTSSANGVFGDYPHFGIWADESGKQNAYLLVTHEFNGAGSTFFGAAYIALERDKMLAGQPAAIVRVPGINAYGALPAHMEGTRLARPGSCPVFTHFDSSTSDYLFWDLCLDWTTPANSTLSSEPQRVAARTPFVPNFNTIPQAGTTAQLDEFGSNLMYRASARAFAPGAPTSMSLVINHSTQGLVEQAGLRWVHFDMRPSGESFDRIFADAFDDEAGPVTLVKSIVDEGLYAPDANHRWMGSVSIDEGANIGAGYSVSSSTLNPKLRVTGRTLADPAGTLRDEQDCTPPTTGSQTSTFSGRGRWGDYASMSVDPSDGCTFWFTSEYFATTSGSSWSTRICTFKFAECGLPQYAITSESPARVEMCGATSSGDPTWSLLAGALGGFTDPVTLSVVGAPAGTTPAFSVNPIPVAPGVSTLTLTGASALPSGEHQFTVEGVSGAQTRAVTLEFGISSTAPAAPTLLAPANTASGVKVRPTLTWSAVPGTLTYLVEVASDAGFATIVASATVTGTSWAVNTTLPSLTQHYWRVRPANYCGDGPTSTAFTFTTGVPGVCPTGTTTAQLFFDDVQGGVNGWTTDGSGGTGWSQVAAPAGTGLTGTVWRVPNNSVTSDRGLISPTINVPGSATAVILSYDVFHNFEIDGPNGCWDGSLIEVKYGAGAFTQLPDNRLFTDPYTGTLTAGATLAGSRAWCHPLPSTSITSIVDIDDSIGQAMQIRFRHVSDSNTTASAPNGMAIRNIKVETCTP